MCFTGVTPEGATRPTVYHVKFITREISLVARRQLRSSHLDGLTTPRNYDQTRELAPPVRAGRAEHRITAQQ